MELFKRSEDPNKGRRHNSYATQHRDVYDQEAAKKSKPKHAASRWYVKWSFMMGFVGAYLLVGCFASVLIFLIKVLASGPVPLFNIDPNKLHPGSAFFGAMFTTQSFAWDFVLFLVAIGCGALLRFILSRRYNINNQELDASDINTHEGDSEIQLPEDLPERYDLAPDAGAHYDVEVTAVLSHMDFSNKGLNTVKVTQRYDKTEDGHFKGEAIVDDNGEVVTKTKPMIDTKFQQALFDASDVPDVKADDGKPLREIYDPTKINYNPKLNIRGKIKAKHVSDLINKTWTFPEYELQRPAGAYVVDTDPNNTMVLAMTRAGKGQTIIEPTIDLWTRSNKPTNFLCNDPKGELYRKFYYPASKRGFDVLCFNLINDSRTNIFNPLDYAVEAARKGNYGKVSEYVKKIGAVFFPEVKGSDPMWNNAANNTFIRSAIGMIDYYYEEERVLRRKAIDKGMSASALERELDILWGHVTLYNVYQMMVQLAGKKSSDPKVISLDPVNETADDQTDESGAEDDEEDEVDYLTLFFNATDKLPRNSIRDDVMNAHNAVNAMAGSDKTIASVYGIALTALSFFTDPKISRLTSGRPSQNFDMVGLAFPRRIEVRIDKEYMQKYALVNNKYRWEAFEDSAMTKPIKDTTYTNVINSDGWLLYTFKPTFKNRKTYLRLSIIEATTNNVMKQYSFEFIKGYQRSLSGKTFVKNPVSDERIIKDGTLHEIKKVVKHDRNGNIMHDENGNKVYTYTKKATTLVKSFIDISRDQNVHDDSDINSLTHDTVKKDRLTRRRVPAFCQIEVHYTESPKAIFVVTPPHMMEYAKLILIMIDQMFNMQVDSAYLTLPSQKPFYGTKYMLDEVGNLQSGGKGIPGLQTKESIGLGQSQQYTLILQTLQQLKDVYGDSIDKILQGNTGNIIYLKSTDDSMLSDLEKLSGITHKGFIDSKSITKDEQAVMNQVDAKMTRTMNIKEQPTITKNDMLHIPKCNDMVFGKGDPIWSTNQTALPMAWRLHKDLVHDPAQPSYALADVPSISNTNDFDRLQNQPNFFAMVKKRVDQARLADEMTDRYRKLHGLAVHGDDRPLDDAEMAKIDHNELADEIMDGINLTLDKAAFGDEIAKQEESVVEDLQDAVDPDEMAKMQAEQDRYTQEDGRIMSENGVTNSQFEESRADAQEEQNRRNAKIYADGRLSKEDVLNDSSLKNCVAKAYSATYSEWSNLGGGKLKLYSNDNHDLTHRSGKIYIHNNTVELENSDAVKYADEQSKDTPLETAFTVSDDFMKILAEDPNWEQYANGHFLEEFIKAFDND